MTPPTTGRRQVLRLACGLLALGAVPAAARAALVDDLQASLAEVARASARYRESLARLLALQGQEAARAEGVAARYQALLAQGLVARRDVERAEEAARHARAAVEETRARMGEADQVEVEAESLRRLAALPPLAAGEERRTAEVVEYRGSSRWTLEQVAVLQQFFAERFGRLLPVSAVGQTPVHDRLGFDHRNAVDVALHPDSVEGRALLDHLRARRLPFLAFRGAVAGASTGAHIHVGAPSPRRT
jgi:hypothetical protein